LLGGFLGRFLGSLLGRLLGSLVGIPLLRRITEYEFHHDHKVAKEKISKLLVNIQLLFRGERRL